jgi:hypothetical protein
MSDWRYHVASLSAVLLALAVGLLVGGIYLSNLPTRLEGRLRSLEEQQRLRAEENRQLRQELEQWEYALDRSQSLYEKLGVRLPQDLLKETKIAIIQTSDSSNAVEPVRRSLQQAGAQVLSTTVINWQETRLEERAVILTNLVKALKGRADDNMEMALRRRQGVRMRGDYRTPCTHVVIIGGIQRESQVPDEVMQAERTLLENLQEAQLYIVACEPFKVQTSFIPFYRNFRVPTLDCADTALGQLILPLLMLEEQGNYGLKTTADKVCPERLWEVLR